MEYTSLLSLGRSALLVALLFIAASTPALCQPISSDLGDATGSESSQLAETRQSNEGDQRQEENESSRKVENEPKKETKNATASLVNEFEALQVTVGKAWKDMEQ